MNVLVCGGAGYIGSHMVKLLAHQGYDVVTFDNLSTGHREAVKWGEFIPGDLLSWSDLSHIFSHYPVDIVMHFSARSQVGESMTHPAIYYKNNLVGTFNLLQQMRLNGVDKFIFSSSAAIYGDPLVDMITEAHPKQPISPYGTSKLMVEQLLQDYARAYEISSVSLRYFNAAGCDPNGEVGECHDPETHLIPNVLKAAVQSAKGSSGLKVFGTDYATPDGTCVRDYVHVEDLCRAHLLALDYLRDHQGAYAFNLGSEAGFSVFDVLQAAERVVGRSIAYQQAPRRAGDPPILVADSQQARQELGWEPYYTEIDTIVDTAWRWQQKMIGVTPESIGRCFFS